VPLPCRPEVQGDLVSNVLSKHGGFAGRDAARFRVTASTAREQNWGAALMIVAGT
jgi:hypothetical protein